MPRNEGVVTVQSAVEKILDLYDAVATGATRGARGSFYANREGTLSDVHVPVEMLEALAAAAGRKVHPRTRVYRKAETGSD